MEAILNEPTTNERKVAGEAYRALETFQDLDKGGELHRLEVSIDGSIKVSIPESALEFLMELLNQMSKGKAITLLPIDSVMSTQQAADMLNVSRPHLVKLLEKGEIPFTKVGRHRRIKTEDLMAYKEKKAEQRREALNKLSEEAQSLPLEY